MSYNIEQSIIEFKERIEKEGYEFCNSLYEWSLTRLMAHKYAYYVLDNAYVPDITYDGEEKSWYVMGRALGFLKEDETSPCVGFDEKHPFAEKGKDLAYFYIHKKYVVL